MFHEEETSIGKIDDYNELISATDGLYASLAAALNYNWGYGFYCSNLRGDDLCEQPPTYINQCPGSNDYSAYSSQFSDQWVGLFKIIMASNNIIHQLDTNNLLSTEYKEVLGEAYFLRAYANFRLTRTYGCIPLVKDIEVKYKLPLATFLEIYEYIESDYKMAIKLLPINNLQSRIPYVTPHKGVVKALLAELYLNWAGYPIKDIEKYKLAASQAKDVIDSANFFGFGLVNDLSWLWDRDHFKNKETVFAVFFSEPINAESFDELYNAYGFHQFEDISSNISVINNNLNIYFYATEKKFYYNYPKNYRKNITFFTKYYNGIDTIEIDSVMGCNRIAYRKFFSFYYQADSSTNENLFYGRYFGYPKVYLFRYASILLTYAEASARAGELNALSFECVNMIRRRANNSNIYITSKYDLPNSLSSTYFIDSVVWERAWEFAGELEGRWYDLVRLEKVEDLPNLQYEDERDNVFEYPIDKEDYFLPIPEDDMRFLNH